MPGRDSVIEVDAIEVARPGAGGIWNAPGNVQFYGAVDVVLDSPASVRAVDLSFDNNDTYRIEALTASGWNEIGSVAPSKTVGMARHLVTLGKEAAGVRRICVTALGGDGQYSLGHLLVR